MYRSNTGGALFKLGAILVGVGFLVTVLFGSLSQWFWIVLALFTFAKIGNHAKNSR